DSYHNEKAIGKALEQLFREGVVRREELFITTKVWSNHHTPELAVESVRRSVADLRAGYVDLALIHWPVSFRSGGEDVPKLDNGSVVGPVDLRKENFEQAYLGLEAAADQGLARSIGVSNFNQAQLERLL